MPQQNQSKNPLHNYAKYSALAFQTGIIMFGMAYGGIQLDAYLALSTPIFTLIFSLLGVGVALYLLFKSVLNSKK
jgi:F0F1-type ATP synthase assembly protein I